MFLPGARKVVVDHPAGIGVERFAALGRPQCPAVPDEELLAQDLLQAADARLDLGARFVHVHEVDEVVEVHGGSVRRARFACSVPT